MSRARPVWVVVPARDEAPRLPAAFAALDASCRRSGGPVHVVVVDDASVDATALVGARLAAAWEHGDASVIEGPGLGVGWARRAGLDRAVIGAYAAGAGDALVASTDADSVVPANWITRLRARASEGHAVIAGDIVLDAQTDPRLVAARDRRLARRLREVHRRNPHAEHPHFAGANLAYSAALLAELAPLPTPFALEDDALGALIEARGIPILRDASFPVTTSSRLDGRAAAGLSHALLDDAGALRISRPGDRPAPHRPRHDPAASADDRRASRPPARPQ